MKRFLATTVIAGIVGFLALGAGYAADSDKDFAALNNELQKKGVSGEDINMAQKPVKEMLERGASKDELMQVMGRLSDSGIKGGDFKQILDAMNSLEKQGKSPMEAENMVSMALSQAQAEGLSGAALADRVQQTMSQMPQEKEQPGQTEGSMKEEQQEDKSEEMQEKASPADADMQGMHKEKKQDSSSY